MHQAGLVLVATFGQPMATLAGLEASASLAVVAIDCVRQDPPKLSARWSSSGVPAMSLSTRSAEAVKARRSREGGIGARLAPDRSDCEVGNSIQYQRGGPKCTIDERYGFDEEAPESPR